MRKIRPATLRDLDTMMALYQDARRFMAEHGNPNQWTDGYPSRQLLMQDMANGNSYVCVEGETIVGTFCFFVGEEPAYRRIENGRWKNDLPYGVVHRITSAAGTHGVASFCLAWCFAQCGNLRIDTHRDNLPMKNALAKNGFAFCGTIYLEDGAERIAFQKDQA